MGYLSMRNTSRVLINRTKTKAAITNGRTVLGKEIDGRSVAARRFKDVLEAFIADLGGESAGLSAGQQAIARRAATLAVECELMELRFTVNGGAKPQEIEVYQRATNTLRRCLESLNIHRGRKARNVTPDLQTYLRGKKRGRQRGDVLDMEAAE